ncbi:hypothetical protein BpHYR1_020993 [Brachionus plicatilis]|uniref:Uncharacterized protein n=1 Tax=Brachionus plicatilis TaxID=10195 RepID=A0A3M7T1G5_BRAPC|nr:hypothetical protein BpHYR1_020993 [Brachionus plicatilis]
MSLNLSGDRKFFLQHFLDNCLLSFLHSNNIEEIISNMLFILWTNLTLEDSRAFRLFLKIIDFSGLND